MGEAATKEGRPRRGRRLAKRALLTLLGAAAVWLALILHPQPLFAYSAERANLVLHTRAPMPPQTGPLLDEVVRDRGYFADHLISAARVQDSPLGAVGEERLRTPPARPPPSPGELLTSRSAAVWLALILHPQPLFAYSAQRANVILTSRAPPPQTGPLR